MGPRMLLEALAHRLDAARADIEVLLGELLSTVPLQHEIARPSRLVEAMRYASLGGGKRIRPFLVIEVGELFGVPRRQALLAGAAVECVHCFSLVHDDLPALDNDDTRRGKPTLHRHFDEATALLAGDGLLTFAFDILARPETHPDPSTRIALVSALARAAGLGGMVGGEMLDLAAEGRFKNGLQSSLDEKEITTMQAMKTGAMLQFACTAGAILGSAPTDAKKAIATYGLAVGEAFQITDDLIDVQGNRAEAGKEVGKDRALGKATLVDLLGVDAARQRVNALVSRALEALQKFGPEANVLRSLAEYIALRRS
jgi:farnesyl diphosphate synthase